jgi:hypothetical protein
LIESKFLTFDQAERGFCFECFDLLGNRLSQNNDFSSTSRKGAEKALYKFLADFKLEAYYFNLLCSEADKAEKKATRLNCCIADTLIED